MFFVSLMVEIPARVGFTDVNPWAQVCNLIFLHLELTSNGDPEGHSWSSPFWNTLVFFFPKKWVSNWYIGKKKDKISGKVYCNILYGNVSWTKYYCIFPYSGDVCQQERVVTAFSVLNTIFRHWLCFQGTSHFQPWAFKTRLWNGFSPWRSHPGSSPCCLPFFTHRITQNH